MTMIEHDSRRHGRLPLPPAHPAEVGLSAERLEHISTWADGWVASGKVPGMITAIVRRGKLVYLHLCGCADVERDRPFQTNTVLRAYSMTKCVTSVVAMVLYERGLFQLDEPISHFLPAFANPRVLLEDGTLVAADREITVKDLLTHTAGLGYGDGEGEIDELYAGARIGWNTPSDMSLAEFVDRLGRIPLGSHPGERWRYSYATDVLGRLLEVWLTRGCPVEQASGFHLSGG
jgi:CubicO group peptidase (beta-lactamase class C family)